MSHDLIRMSAYDPQVLSVLFKTFDEAWAEIAAYHLGDPASTEEVRRDLAAVILEFARLHQHDPAALKDLAVVELRKRNGRGRETFPQNE